MLLFFVNENICWSCLRGDNVIMKGHLSLVTNMLLGQEAAAFGGLVSAETVLYKHIIQVYVCACVQKVSVDF